MNSLSNVSLAGQRVVVVGAGIIGTMHALFALNRGAHVVHLERDHTPHGATVRNFGLVWVSGRAPGRELDFALRARELWQSIGSEVPDVGFRPNGSFTLARRDDEMAVLQKAAQRFDADKRGFVLMDAHDVRAMNPALRGEFLGGLHCRTDAAVESRRALGALRTHMLRSGRYEFFARREIVNIGDYEVVDHQGKRHRADQVFLCLGASLSGFAAELFDGEALGTVRLQMAETEPFDSELTTSVANGDSLRYYPAFREFVGELIAQDEEAARFSIQLLCQQRLHGGLTIGDTHEDGSEDVFEYSDRPMQIIVDAARSLLGQEMPRIARRWSGTYHQLRNPLEGEIYFRKRVSNGVTAVTGAGGRGMTLAPAIAEESFS